MRVTPPPPPEFRYALVVSAITAVFFALAVSTLVAPGPPVIFIEPQTRMELVAIEPGTFTMGSRPDEAGRQADETPHAVTIPERFYMGRHEVTQTEWTMVMGENPSHQQDCGRCPVENVDFYRVSVFITNLNAQSTSMRYRLPTEAEWEYVCRAGTKTAFAFGDTLAPAQANLDARAPSMSDDSGDSWGKTMPVGSYAPNAWGLHDMHGNVWEWTNDWYGPYGDGPEANPRGAPGGSKRVIRGGSWRFGADSARCALRYTHAPQDKGYSLGFRIVAEPIRRR